MISCLFKEGVSYGNETIDPRPGCDDPSGSIGLQSIGSAFKSECGD
jgi:hypothetical protein